MRYRWEGTNKSHILDCHKGLAYREEGSLLVETGVSIVTTGRGY